MPTVFTQVLLHSLGVITLFTVLYQSVRIFSNLTISYVSKRIGTICHKFLPCIHPKKLKISFTNIGLFRLSKINIVHGDDLSINIDLLESWLKLGFKYIAGLILSPKTNTVALNIYEIRINVHVDKLEIVETDQLPKTKRRFRRRSGLRKLEIDTVSKAQFFMPNLSVKINAVVIDFINPLGSNIKTLAAVRISETQLDIGKTDGFKFFKLQFDLSVVKVHNNPDYKTPPELIKLNFGLKVTKTPTPNTIQLSKTEFHVNASVIPLIYTFLDDNHSAFQQVFKNLKSEEVSNSDPETSCSGSDAETQVTKPTFKLMNQSIIKAQSNSNQSLAGSVATPTSHHFPLNRFQEETFKREKLPDILELTVSLDSFLTTLTYGEKVLKVSTEDLEIHQTKNLDSQYNQCLSFKSFKIFTVAQLISIEHFELKHSIGSVTSLNIGNILVKISEQELEPEIINLIKHHILPFMPASQKISKKLTLSPRNSLNRSASFNQPKDVLDFVRFDVFIESIEFHLRQSIQTNVNCLKISKTHVILTNDLYASKCKTYGLSILAVTCPDIITLQDFDIKFYQKQLDVQYKVFSLIFSKISTDMVLSLIRITKQIALLASQFRKTVKKSFENDTFSSLDEKKSEKIVPSFNLDLTKLELRNPDTGYKMELVFGLKVYRSALHKRITFEILDFAIDDNCGVGIMGKTGVKIDYSENLEALQLYRGLTENLESKILSTRWCIFCEKVFSPNQNLSK